MYSLNVRGLRTDNNKRKKIFELFNKQLKGITFLQETHSTPEIESKWNREWGGHIIFSHGSSRSKGVAILIPKYMDYKINNIHKDPEGRYIIVDISCLEDTYVLINIYAPTQNSEKDQITFIKTIQDILAIHEGKHIIIGGDFNVVLDPNKDKKGGNIDQSHIFNYRTTLKALVECYELCDIWRLNNENKRMFTWHCKKKKIYCRLDYWLVSEHLTNLIYETDIIPSVVSDHSIIKISIRNPKLQTRGPGYWKFNITLLRDKQYIKHIKHTISKSEALHQYDDKAIVWELIKMDIRSATMSYCKHKRQASTKYEKHLETQLKILHESLMNESDTDNIHKQIEDIEQELKSIASEKIAGIILRSKIRWTEDGEKNSSYFLNLEKRNYMNKHISQLIINNKLTTNPEEILHEEKKFYKNLYNEHVTNNEQYIHIQNIFLNKRMPTLTEDEKSTCEITVDESKCAEALKYLKNGKTPGIDGLPPEFYKFFWPDIKHLVTNSLEYGFKKGVLSSNQKLGVITLIPKKDKDRNLLKNWRPLSLLTTDYKIITKILALHITKVLPSIINEDQSAYIKGRYIGENIRTIADIIEYCKRKNLTGILLLVDFEKAFDTVRWNFLDETLKKFNFGTIFRKWIRIIYTSITGTVSNNGYFSDYFYILRGVRQGCPLSAYLFLLIVEIMAINIRANTNIKGIKLKTKEIKISQLADDTTLIMETYESIKHVRTLLTNYGIISGLKTNMDKTQAFMIGKHMKRYKDTEAIKWSDYPIHTLGIYICKDETDNIKYNFAPKVKLIKTMLNIWKQRNLSLKGKITVLNSLAASQLVYISSTIETPEIILKEIEKIFFDFLWNSKVSKIAKSTIIQNIEDGGLKMIEIFSKVKALKLGWIKRAITNPSSTWTLILDNLLNDIPFEYLIKSKSQNKLLESRLPTFYTNILNDWNYLNDSEPISTIHITGETLWFNKFITVDRTPIFWKEWFEHGIRFISDLLDSSFCFLSQEEIQNKYNIKCSFMEHMRIRQALPGNWRKKIHFNITTVNTPNNHPVHIYNGEDSYDLQRANSKYFYHVLIKMGKYAKPNCITRWENIYEIDPVIWPSLFKAPFLSCRETYLQSFQYRIIHRILPCNNWLFTRKIIPSNICTDLMCDGQSVDNITHHLILCPPVQIFWESFVTWWNNMNFSKLCPLVQENILLGFPCEGNEDFILNYCLILAKYYIHSCKRNKNKVFFLHFLTILRNKITIEEAISIQNSKEQQYYVKWGYLHEHL